MNQSAKDSTNTTATSSHTDNLYLSPKLIKLKETLDKFVLEECQPAEEEYNNHLLNRIGKDRWSIDAVPPCMERLKSRACELGLWNLFLPKSSKNSIPSDILSSTNKPSIYLTNAEYAQFCESMGKSFLTPEACNCSAPDTGNMEVLLHFGTRHQQETYLKPLLDGTIRSTFLMTEPFVASSDASNIETKLRKVSPGKYILSGRKWWSTGAMDPRCKVAIILAKMEGHDKSFTTVVLPMSAPGIQVIRPLTVFGHDDAPHGHAEVLLDNVIVSSNDLILGEGKGYEIAQARLGPGRVHHCMRAVGLAARCYELMIQRSIKRETFKIKLYKHGMVQHMISESKIHLDSARLLTLDCAYSMDKKGNSHCKDKIALIKIAVPNLCLKVVDCAIQIFGGAGVSDDFPLAYALTSLRCLRIADGPDEVHRRTLARIEVKKASTSSNMLDLKSRL